jgi:hypothetical protein
MRPALFASITAISAVASFAAFACDPVSTQTYTDQMNMISAEYKSAVDVAYRTYADRNFHSYELASADFRFFPVRWDISGRPYRNVVLVYDYPAPDSLQDWQNSVNSAMENYRAKAKVAYDNYINTCAWWW